jgi:hypothetical protein
MEKSWGKVGGKLESQVMPPPKVGVKFQLYARCRGTCSKCMTAGPPAWETTTATTIKKKSKWRYGPRGRAKLARSRTMMSVKTRSMGSVSCVSASLHTLNVVESTRQTVALAICVCVCCVLPVRCVSRAVFCCCMRACVVQWCVVWCNGRNGKWR